MTSPPSNPWLFGRPEIALKYLQLFEIGPGTPLAFSGETGIGKTTFLLQDMMSAAQALFWTPLYIDFASANDPAEAVIDAIRRTEIGQAAARRRAPREPENSLLRLAHWLRILAQGAPKRALLLIDNVEALEDDDGAIDIYSALKSIITELGASICVVFTETIRPHGSSVFAQHRSPLRGLASQIVFPPLGTAFVQHVAEMFARQLSGGRLGRKINVDRLGDAYQRLGNKPGLLTAMVGEMLRDGSTSISPYLTRQVAALRALNDHGVVWERCKPIEKAILTRLARQEPLFGKDALTDYSARLSVPVKLGSVQHAMRMLVGRRIVATGTQRAEYHFSDPGLGPWIAANA